MSIVSSMTAYNRAMTAYALFAVIVLQQCSQVSCDCGPPAPTNCETSYACDSSSDNNDDTVCTARCNGDSDNECGNFELTAEANIPVQLLCSGQNTCSTITVRDAIAADVQITCEQQSVCSTITVENVGSGNVQIFCNARGSCRIVSITGVVSGSVEIFCTGKSSCLLLSVSTTVDGGSVDIYCDGEDSCESATVNAEGSSATTLTCSGENSCIQATINGASTVPSLSVICNSSEPAVSACYDSDDNQPMQITSNGAQSVFYDCGALSCQTIINIDAEDSDLLEINVSGDENALITGGTVTCPNSGLTQTGDYSCFFFAEYTGDLGTSFGGHTIDFNAVEGLSRDLFIECSNYPDASECFVASSLSCTKTFEYSCNLTALEPYNDTNGAQCINSTVDDIDCGTYFLVPPEPTMVPSAEPSFEPSEIPSNHPSNDPTTDPSIQPSNQPSIDPTKQPSGEPTARPSGMPTITLPPTGIPSDFPSDVSNTAMTAMPTPQRDGDGSGADGSDGDLDSGIIILIVSVSILGCIIVLCLAYIVFRSKKNKSGGAGSNSEATDTSKRPEKNHWKSKNELQLATNLRDDESKPPPPDGPVRPITGATTGPSVEPKTSATDANKAVAVQVNGQNAKEQDLLHTEAEEEDMKQISFGKHETPGGPGDGADKNDSNVSADGNSSDPNAHEMEISEEANDHAIKFPPIGKVKTQQEILDEIARSQQRNPAGGNQ